MLVITETDFVLIKSFNLTILQNYDSKVSNYNHTEMRRMITKKLGEFQYIYNQYLN